MEEVKGLEQFEKPDIINIPVSLPRDGNYGLAIKKTFRSTYGTYEAIYLLQATCPGSADYYYVLDCLGPV
jgi:hypothetical protein